MRGFRLAVVGLAVALTAAPGCNSDETPKMVGKEALDKLPQGEPVKSSPRAKKLRVSGPAGAGSGEAGIPASH